MIRKNLLKLFWLAIAITSFFLNGAGHISFWAPLIIFFIVITGEAIVHAIFKINKESTIALMRFLSKSLDIKDGEYTLKNGDGSNEDRVTGKKTTYTKRAYYKTFSKDSLTKKRTN